MRYTIDDFEEGDDRSSPSGDPLLVEVFGPEAKPTPFRNPDGTIIGWQAASESGRPVGLFYGDAELLERIEGLRQAVRELSAQLDALEIAINGDDPQDPDAEAEARTRMHRLDLFAYAAAAVELETEQG